MSRLSRGVVSKTVHLVSSACLLSSSLCLPALAESVPAPPTIKTIAPLPPAESPATPADKTGLTFMSDDEPALDQMQLSGTAPAGSGAQASPAQGWEELTPIAPKALASASQPAATSAPQAVSVQGGRADTGVPEAPSTDNGQALVSAPQAVSVQGGQADTGVPEALATDNGQALASAPQAVSQLPPASNQALPPSADTSEQNPAAAGDGKTPAESQDGPVPLAQAGAPLYVQPPQQQKYARPIPQSTGSVNIRRPFKLFAREELIRNLSFRETPVREVIAELARRGNLNIMIDRSVTGKITGDLHDVTLNEAMDSVLAAAGLQSRQVANAVIVATPNAMFQLGLNRPMAKAFKLNYIHPYDVAQILTSSVFNRGYVPDFTAVRRATVAQQDRDEKRQTEQTAQERENVVAGEGGGREAQRKNLRGEVGAQGSTDIRELGEVEQRSRPDVERTMRGITRQVTLEGTGFNNAANDPGTQQIRAFTETAADFTVIQNGGGAVVVPDVRNKQVVVVGNADDIAVAEEALRFIDRRPREIHIQASLVELSNDGVRQLGATLALQGQGASASILGNRGVPLVQYLPGLGSPGNTIAPAGATFNDTVTGTGFPPAQTFARTATYTFDTVNQTVQPNDVSPTAPGQAFTGLIGSLIPVAPTVLGLQPSGQASSVFDLLTLSKAAGGRQNIATLPTALGLHIRTLLETQKAKIIANPSVVVSDDTESLVTIADEVIHKVTNTVSLGVVSTNVELTKAGVFLNVLPRVTDDGFIIMRLRPQVSIPGQQQVFGGQQNPTIVTLLSIREVMSQQVRVKDGQTLVIGGLFRETEAATISKLPYLAETPILGALFRHTLKARRRSELMLLITPKIVEEEPPQLSESGPVPTM